MRVTVTLLTASGKPAKGICLGVGPVVTIFLSETGRAGYAPAGQDGQAWVDLINENISQTIRYFQKKADGTVVELGSQLFKGPVPGNTYSMATLTLTGLP